MINLCSASYNAITGVHKCDCGKIHEFSVKALAEPGAFSRLSAFLSDITPPLSRIAILYDNEELLSEVNAALKRDFRATCIGMDDDKKKAELLTLPEDTKLIVAVGSRYAVNGAKYKACLDGLPLVVVGLPDFDTLTPVCVVKEEGQCLSYVIDKPLGLLCDTNFIKDKDKAVLFGSIAARLNTSFEYYVSSLLSGRDYCPFLAGYISDIAAKTVLTVSERDRNAPTLVQTLVEAAVKLALISPLLPRFGETQCGITYTLFAESNLAQGELQFIFSAVLSSLYKSHILRRASFVPPPDNNYRLSQIASLLGVSEARAIKSVLPQLSGRDAAVIEYKIREYSADMLEKLNTNINLFKTAFKTFKRLHSDDGYALSELPNGDISLSIALAPDIVNGEGMLTALKRLGELDDYIV